MLPVLISHSSRDKEFVRRLADDLTREGVTVWFDEAELRVGDQLSAIEETIRASQCLVLVLSNAAVESDWVQREVELARRMGVRILPAVMQEVPRRWDGDLAELAIADFRGSDRRGLWGLISAITGRPNPLITAKKAAQRVKTEMAVTGEIFGLSQQGVATFYSFWGRGDWGFGDASEGLSRLWIVEIYDRERKAVHPFALMDHEIHELPVLYLLDSDPVPVADSAIIMSCTLNISSAGVVAPIDQEHEKGGRRLAKRYTRFRPVPLTRDFVDSDVAVKCAAGSPEAERRLGGRAGRLFTLTKLEADKVHGNAVLWKVSFFDPALAESVLTVGVGAVTGEVKYPAMRAEVLNANFMHFGERDGQIVLSVRNQLRAMEGHAWDIAMPGDSFSPRLTAADALRLATSALGEAADSWQLAFLSSTGVMRSLTSGPGPATERLMRVDGTAGQWVVEVCGTKATPVSDGSRSGFEYDFQQILVTREKGAVLVDSVEKCVFTVPLSRCPMPPNFLAAYEDALALALRTVSVDFEALSVAHSRPSGGLQWCFRFYDSEEIVQKIWVTGDGSRVVE